MKRTERLRKEMKVKKDFKQNKKGLKPSVKKIVTTHQNPKPMYIKEDATNANHCIEKLLNTSKNKTKDKSIKISK